MTPPHLVLGTAQLGLPYGVANRTGQPDQRIATAIVREAWENGIREFDTAQGYGTSEAVLGKALYQLGIAKKAKIITKFHPCLDHLDASLLSDALNQSLEKLGCHRLYGIMLHREEVLSQWDRGLNEIFGEFVLSGMVKRIGVSVYSPQRATKALKTDGIDMIQLPANLLDRRFEKSGVYQLAAELNKTIYIRSVFLQGLILMNPGDIPHNLSFTRPVIKKIKSLSHTFGLSPQEMALGYIKAELPDGHVLFGAETPLQVRENMTAWQKKMPGSFKETIKSIFHDVDEQILNPSLWSRSM